MGTACAEVFRTDKHFTGDRQVGEGGGRTHIYLSDLGLAQLGFRGEPRSLQPVRRHLEGEPGPALEEIVMKLREAGRNRLPTPL